MKRVVLAMAAVALVLGACGGDDSPGDAVAAAGNSLSRIHSGVMHMSVTLQADTAPVGFQMDGPFDLTPSGATLPIADLTTTVLGAAPGKGTSHFVSTGQSAFVVEGDIGYELTNDQLGSLRVSSGSTPALQGIDLRSWVQNAAAQPPTTVDGEAADRVTGQVDPVGMLNGVVALASDFGNADDAKLGVKDADADRVRSAVKSSNFEVTLGSKDRLLRSFKATVEFAAVAQPGDNAVLAQLAKIGHVTLTVELRIERPNTPVSVQPPAQIRPITELPKS